MEEEPRIMTAVTIALLFKNQQMMHATFFLPSRDFALTLVSWGVVNNAYFCGLNLDETQNVTPLSVG